MLVEVRAQSVIAFVLLSIKMITRNDEFKIVNHILIHPKNTVRNRAFIPRISLFLPQKKM